MPFSESPTAVCRQGVLIARLGSRRGASVVACESFPDVSVLFDSWCCFSLSAPLSDAVLVAVTGLDTGWLGCAAGDTTPSEPPPIGLDTGRSGSAATLGERLAVLSPATNSGAAALSFGLPGSRLAVVKCLNTASSSGRTNGIESLFRSLPYRVMQFWDSNRSALRSRSVWLPMNTRIALLVSGLSCWSMPVTSKLAVILGSCDAGLPPRELDWVTRASARKTGSVIL